MSKEQQELLDEGYKNWKTKGRDFWEEQVDGMFISELGEEKVDKISKTWFIDKIKTDPEFSEKWGLTIEERELSLEERLLLADKINKEIRQDLYTYAFNNPIYTGGIDQRPDDVERHNLLSDLNIPTKLITIKYNDKKIESYE
jgi:hypothetical protein